jgi:Flp pilus assembly protein CpaB
MRRRWSRSSRLYMSASVVAAAAAGILLNQYVARTASVAEALGPKVAVVVATQHVERGSVLAPEQVGLDEMPEAYAPPGVIEEISKAAGRVALSDLASGEVVTETRLARVRAGPVASLVPEGLRAFAVPTSLPHGALVPGDRVDVLATFASGQPHTETVVSGVEVLFVLVEGAPGGDTSGLGLDASAASIGEATTLILLVSPFQEEDLAFARAFADLQVAIAPSEEPTL